MTETTIKAAPVQIVVSAEQHAAKELAEELAAMKAEGRTMDKTVPGGRYLDAQGRARNAHGMLIDDKAAKGLPTDQEDILARLKEIDQEREALIARAQQNQATAEAEANAAAESGGSVGQDEDEDDTPRRRSSARRK